MSGLRKLIVIVSLLVLLIVIGIFATIQALGRRVPDNDISVRGNSPGNLYNGGYFCERDGVVYFANPSDNNCLYAMTPAEGEYRRLSPMSVSNILSAGNFVYYYMDSHTRSVSQGLGSAVEEYGIYRIRNDGKYSVCLLRERVDSMQLGGNYIYYEQGEANDGSLERISTTKKGRTGYGSTPSLFEEHINPAAYESGMIFYSSIRGGYGLYQLNLERDPVSASPLLTSVVYQPIVQGSDVYFLNAADGYRVCRYNVPTGTITTLTPYGADCYNLDGNYIYYDSQDADVPGLYRCRLDGSDNQLLQAGAFHALHLTSGYLYYQVYGTEGVFYHIPLTGMPTPGVFMPEVIQ